MVACRENGKESAMRLIKHFSSECEDDWKKESCLVNELGETGHPNILTHCWHCKGMCPAACLENVLERKINSYMELCFSGGETLKLGKSSETRKRIRVLGQGTARMTFGLGHTTHLAVEGSRGSEGVKLHSFRLILSLFS